MSESNDGVEGLIRQIDAIQAKITKINEKLKGLKDDEKRKLLIKRRSSYYDTINDIVVQIHGLYPEFEIKLTKIQKNKIDPVVKGTLQPITPIEERSMEGLRTYEDYDDIESEGSYIPPDRMDVMSGCKLTSTQAYLCDLYFNEGWSMEKIAEYRGVTRSSICKTIGRAKKNINAHYQQIILVERYTDKNGILNWSDYLPHCTMVTDRQRSIMMMKLENPRITMGEIGRILGVTNTVISHTISKIKRNLRRVAISESNLNWLSERGKPVAST